MPRDVERLSHAPCDLLVIGGGIHGLMAAYDAASRGLSVALVERADFGGALSFNHQRTLHGGLRALEGGHVGKARQQIAERRTWAVIAPHLIRPLPFLIGTYRWSKRSRTAIRTGFKLYDLIGRSRNRGVSPELHIPRTRLESAAATRRLFPGVSESGLTGGAIWYDYQMTHPDRLNGVVRLAATAAGANLANYAEALEPLRTGTTIAGARVRDLVTGREFDIAARATLLAAGGGIGPLMSAFGVTGAPPLVRAMNLLLDRPARDIATAAPGRSGRMLTAVPWQGRVLVGTGQSDVPIDPAANDGGPTRADIEKFLEDVSGAFPRLSATMADVCLVHHGLTPAIVRHGRADLLPESQLISHGQVGAPGLFSLIGVKYTTARRAAADAVDAIAVTLGRPVGRSVTATRVLPHADIADTDGRLAETLRELGGSVDRDVLSHLASWYGTEASDVVRSATSPADLARLSATTPVIAAEISYAAERSQVVRLSDVVFRRTPLGSAGHPGLDALERAAAILGARLGWSDARRADELADVLSRYPAI